MYSNCPEKETESNHNTNPSLTQKASKDKAKWLCYFDDRWKNTCNRIREINNQHSAFWKISWKEFGTRHAREGDAKAQTETESQKFWMRQIGLTHQSKVFSLPKRHESSVNVGSHWFRLARNTHYCVTLLIALWIKLDFLIRRSQLKCPIDEQKRKFCSRDVLVSNSVELILLDLTKDDAFYSVSTDVWNHSN